MDLFMSRAEFTGVVWPSRITPVRYVQRTDPLCAFMYQMQTPREFCVGVFVARSLNDVNKRRVFEASAPVGVFVPQPSRFHEPRDASKHGGSKFEPWRQPVHPGRRRWKTKRERMEQGSPCKTITSACLLQSIYLRHANFEARNSKQ